MLLWRDGTIEQVEARMPEGGEVAWLHLVAPGVEEVQRTLGDLFHCHPLAVEDTVNFGQRTKLDHYAVSKHPHAYITFFSVGDDMSLREFCIVVSDNYVITVAEKEIPWLQKLYKDMVHTPDTMDQTGTLLHRILDMCVDSYFALIEDLETKLDSLERRVFHHPEEPAAPIIFRLKRRINRLRRVSADGKGVIGLLTHDSFPYTEEKHVVYFVDIYDHISRIVDSLDAIRDNLSGLLDLHTSQRANRMNEIMKTLTIISTVFLPLSFIVGLYGMNFKEIPELSWTYGYLYVWVLMIAVVGGFFWYFKRKRWW